MTDLTDSCASRRSILRTNCSSRTSSPRSEKWYIVVSVWRTSILRRSWSRGSSRQRDSNWSM